MKQEDIRALRGQQVAVGFPMSEAGMGYGTGDPLVQATVIEAPVEWSGFGQLTKRKGARLRLDEPLRITHGDSWREMPIGHEFHAESRLVSHPWGRPPRDRRLDDEQRKAERAKRYAEQDVIRAAFAALGMAETTGGFRAPAGFALAGGEVKIDRAKLAELLRRIVPEVKAGEVPLAVAGPVSDALRYVEAAAERDLADFEGHELHRLASIAGDVRARAEELRSRFELAEYQVRTGRPF